jgi:hypothetical protein
MDRYQAVAVDGLLKTPWRDPVALWIGVAVKVASIGLLLFGASSGLQQFEGKAFVWRLATYPVAALVVPLVWTLRGRRPSYPYAADVLLTLSYLIDTALKRACRMCGTLLIAYSAGTSRAAG